MHHQRHLCIAELLHAANNNNTTAQPHAQQPPRQQQASRKYGLSRAPKLVEMIAAVPEEHRAVLLPQLRAKPVRTASGIAVVAVMSKPHRCPHIATTGKQAHSMAAWGWRLELLQHLAFKQQRRQFTTAHTHTAWLLISFFVKCFCRCDSGAMISM